MRPLLPVLSLSCLLSFALPAPTRAAETYHTCAGFITSVPATITTQGTWCLRHDLATAIAGGAAITIATNNVTLDCNGFKLGGLAAGPQSQATGVLATERQNITVRRCSVRGFLYGIDLYNGAGHAAEDNRLDNNLRVGIRISGDSSLVRGNQVHDTGGGAPGTVVLRESNLNMTIPVVASIAIAASGAVIVDNIVQGSLTPDGVPANVRGIVAYGNGLAVRGNVVRKLASSASAGSVYGIHLAFSDGLVTGNSVHRIDSGAGPTLVGIRTDIAASLCEGNFVQEFPTAFDGCTQP